MRERVCVCVHTDRKPILTGSVPIRTRDSARLDSTAVNNHASASSCGNEAPSGTTLTSTLRKLTAQSSTNPIYLLLKLHHTFNRLHISHPNPVTITSKCSALG